MRGFLFLRLAGLLSRSFPCPPLPFPPRDPRVAGTERRASGKPTAAETGTESRCIVRRIGYGFPMHGRPPRIDGRRNGYAMPVLAKARNAQKRVRGRRFWLPIGRPRAAAHAETGTVGAIFYLGRRNRYGLLRPLATARHAAACRRNGYAEGAPDSPP